MNLPGLMHAFCMCCDCRDEMMGRIKLHPPPSQKRGRREWACHACDEEHSLCHACHEEHSFCLKCFLLRSTGFACAGRRGLRSIPVAPAQFRLLDDHAVWPERKETDRGVHYIIYNIIPIEPRPANDPPPPRRALRKCSGASARLTTVVLRYSSAAALY